MPKSSILRTSSAIGAAALLSACVSTDPQTATATSADARPAELRTITVSESERRDLAREVQLQTPVELPPENTGAPPPGFHGNSVDVGSPELLAEGADITADLRVWQRWTAGTRQIYGPQPTAIDPIIRPVTVAPE
ncbi:MAG: hypothetical protein AAF646_08590 [Pseudomonadota bacterium]